MEEALRPSDWSEEGELVRELLEEGYDNNAVVTEDASFHQNYHMRKSSSVEQAIINRFISNIYTGPTISDIENALSLTSHHQRHQLSSPPRYLFS